MARARPDTPAPKLPKTVRSTKALALTPEMVPPPRMVIPIPSALPKPPMKSWSFSSLGDFEKCKFYSFLKRVQKVPEPERPLPPGKMEHANDRGSRMHDDAEQFVRGNLKHLTRELLAFETEFNSLRKSFANGVVSLEGEWGMSKDWEPQPWSQAWLRLKLDAMVFISPTEVVIVDYKSGRKFGNEVKHADQLQLYQLVTFLRFPQVETIHAELWYLDQDEITSMTYQRHQGLRFKPKWNQRGLKMMEAVDFPANPNIFSCRYCMYGPRGSGICEKGV